MVMMLKPRCNRRSGWGKGLLDRKRKNTYESFKNQGDDGGDFLIEKALSFMRFVQGGQMVHEQLYPEILARLRDAVRRKRPEIWESQTWMLHHDNAPTHESLLISSYLAKYHISVVPHPTYFPELAPAEFFLFPKFKTTLKERRFQTIEEIQENATRELRAITENAFQEEFQQWKKSWKRFIASRGDYFEGNRALNAKNKQ